MSGINLWTQMGRSRLNQVAAVDVLLVSGLYLCISSVALDFDK